MKRRSNVCVESRLNKPRSRPGRRCINCRSKTRRSIRLCAQLAERLNLEFDWDRTAMDAAGIAADQLVSVKVKDASLDELVRAVLAGTGLAFRRNDRKILLYPAKP